MKTNITTLRSCTESGIIEQGVNLVRVSHATFSLTESISQTVRVRAQIVRMSVSQTVVAASLRFADFNLSERLFLTLKCQLEIRGVQSCFVLYFKMIQIRLVAIAVAALFVLAVFAQDPSYDHQKKTYTPQFKPVTKTNAHISIMPFFSPDHSIDTTVHLIENATKTIDISTPGFSSWIGCTYFEEGCVGCTITKQLNETFPVWPALLNAAHRGVKIRLLTNDYSTPTCRGQIAPMDWLYANGVDIRYYTSTTFTHSKYMSTDGTQTSVSSVNFSQASFMKNREAGVVLGAGAEDMIAMATAVFEFDWAQAYAYTFDRRSTRPQLR